MEFANTYAKIDLDAIAQNYENLCRRAGVPVMAVVKADAYGHGAVPVAKTLASSCGFFGVSSVAEALELRHAGITQPILILGHTPPENYSHVVSQDVRVAVFTWEDAQKLSREAVRQEKTARLHIALDTGMSRIGFQATAQAADTCARIAALPGLEVEGLFTHFATADEEDLTRTKAQAALFDRFDAMLRARGLEIPIKHLDNSAGIANFGAHGNMVRGGIALYGLYPSEKVCREGLELKPAMSWYSRVSHVATLPAGRELSYGGTYTTRQETVVATLPVGYADGYRRSLSNRFYVLIHGKKAPILGRVCMDQMMVDVTNIPGVAPGDPVVLLGRSGTEEITAGALAEAADSFQYEQVCDLSRRVARVYLRQGREEAHVNYLL